MDKQLKFFELQNEERDSLQVVYKSKVPSEIFAFDVSKDGCHYAMGLNDCSIVVKSKVAEVDLI